MSEAQSSDLAPFERLEAWQVSRRFVNRAYAATDAFPTNELYGLTGQIRRAAVSVSANIAEGSARRGPKEFRRFLDVALGSLAELRCLLTLANDRGYLNDKDFSELVSMRNALGRLTWRLYKSQLDACHFNNRK